jgi:hypothetical protein
MAEKQKQARLIGVITLTVLVGLAGFAFLMQAKQGRQAEADYALAEEAIAAGILAGKNLGDGCADKAGAAREAIARQLRRGGAKKFFINKKAVVYDLLLQGALPICMGDPAPVYEKFNGCAEAVACRGEAVVALLAGNTEAATQAVQKAISYREDDSLRELQSLIEKISSSIQ